MIHSYQEWQKIAPGLDQAWEIAYQGNGRKGRILPSFGNTFRALDEVRPFDVRVVILGQDPYHSTDEEGRAKASGLAFGYYPWYTGPINSSLLNVLTEMGATDETQRWNLRTLEHLPPQGVLLLNTRLTVIEDIPLSHAYGSKYVDQVPGWEKPVQQILSWIATNGHTVVWLLWGAEARRLAERAGLSISGPNVIVTSHPCRFSNTRTIAGGRPFTGSDCFRRCNLLLVDKPIDWLDVKGET